MYQDSKTQYQNRTCNLFSSSPWWQSKLATRPILEIGIQVLTIGVTIPVRCITMTIEMTRVKVRQVTVDRSIGMQ